jgi:branched-chain amino acid transport system substrate-binding protein
MDTPFGKVTFRSQDHQSTMGAFVGRIKYDGGKGVMVDYRYADGAQFQPSDAEVAKLRTDH